MFTPTIVEKKCYGNLERKTQKCNKELEENTLRQVREPSTTAEISSLLRSALHYFDCYENHFRSALARHNSN